MGSMRRSRAFTHGPQARKRSATDWSVMDSYRAVKMPATSRKGLSKPQYKKTTRKSCAGVLTFLALTNALNSRAICTVSGGRSCKSSSKSVSGSVRGNCMGRFSCRQQGDIFTSCSMPSFSPIYSVSWRLWGFGARQLRAALASTPLFGAGRVEDTLNLLGHALRKAVGLAAHALETSAEAVVESAGLTLVGHSSLKAALGLDWGEPRARARALGLVLKEVARWQRWLEQQTLAAQKPPL